MKIIEHNSTYLLAELENNNLGKVVVLDLSHTNPLTPQQAYALGKQLINWVASVDPELTAIS